jgi:hypothetical protein
MEELAVLVRRAQSGDLSAFAEIVRRFRDMACGYAHSRLGDFQSAEDARALPGIKDGIGDADGRLPYTRPPHGRRTAPRCSLQCTLGPQRMWSRSRAHLSLRSAPCGVRPPADFRRGGVRYCRWREAAVACGNTVKAVARALAVAQGIVASLRTAAGLREAQAECACSVEPGDGGPFSGTTACAHTYAIHHRLARSIS